MNAIPKREHEFLITETANWTESGLITPEQAEGILSLYEVKEHSLRMILFTAGCVLLGLGGVSFIAAHWHELPKLLRVCALVSGHVVSVLAYIFAGRNKSRWGRSFLLLASLIFGAGIYLITRMYDIKLTFSEVLGYWLVELVVMTLCTRDDWQEYFAQAVSLVYLVSVNAIDIFALEFMGSSRVGVSEFFSPVEGFVLLAMLWAMSHFVRSRAALNVNMLLTLLVFASRMSLCFGGTWTLVLLAVAGGLLSFCRKPDAEVMGLLVMGLCGLVLTWPEVWRDGFAPYGEVLAVVSAVVTGCVMVANIWRSHTAVGVSFCALLIVRYFFDRLFGYMPKAWGFTLMGVVFLGAGAFFGKLRRLFVSAEASDDEEAVSEDV